MENCIYYCDGRDGLTYNNKEHIIPAAIGGHLTLPKGYVSDQANNNLSKYELSYIRYSPLFIARAKYGPGKRGSFDINKIDYPDVLSLEPMETNGDSYICPLGFLFSGKLHIISQYVVVFDNDLKNYNVILLKPDNSNLNNRFKENLDSGIQILHMPNEKNCKRIPIPYKTKKCFSCMGWYKKNWFFCSTHPDATIDGTLQQILHKRPLSQNPEKHLGFSLSTPMFHYSRGFPLENLSYAFLHAKNCFNTLAFFKGNEFVRHKMFDQFRECILSNTNWGDVCVPTKCTPPHIKQWLRKNICNHEHVVALYVHKSDIMAFSVIYGKSWGLFRLGTGYLDTPFSHAIVCDFENGNNDKDEKIFDELIL